MVIFLILIIVVWVFIGSITGGLPSAEGGACTLLFGADSDFCKSARDSTKNQAEVKKDQAQAERKKPKPVSEGGIAGELKCTLFVHVFAKLDSKPIIPYADSNVLYIKIDEKNPNTYRWECNQSEWDLFLASFSNLNFTPNALILAGETIHTEIVLKMKDDKFYKFDANLKGYEMMYRNILLTETTGFVPTPYNLSPYSEFVMPKIPYGDYDLEIYYGRVINNLEVGQPIKSNICMDEDKVQLIPYNVTPIIGWFEKSLEKSPDNTPDAVVTGNKILPPCR